MTVGRRDDFRDSRAIADAVENWSQVDVERALMEAARAATKARVELRHGALELGRTKPAYKAIRARVALEWRKHDLDSNVPSRGAGSVTESLREARVDADERVQTAAFAFYTAEAVFNAQVEAARLHRSEISALQSILADLRPMVSER